MPALDFVEVVSLLALALRLLLVPLLPLEDVGDERAEWIRRAAEIGRPLIYANECGWSARSSVYYELISGVLDAGHFYFKTGWKPTPYDALIALAEACIEAETV